MNKILRKILVLLTCLLTVCSLTVAFGAMPNCSNPQTSKQDSSIDSGILGQPQEPEVENATISFAVSEKLLTVGDEEYLSPVYQKIDGYSLTYKTDDSSVVSVDKNGKICALKEGSTTVKAIYSNGENSVEASLTVNCSFSGYLPELKTTGVANSISIAVKDSYKVLPYIAFNGKEFEDATLSYRVVDQEVATVSKNGLITAKAKGQTQLIIEASWRGKDKSNAPTMQKVVELSVINDVKFYNDGQSILDEELYTLAQFDGKTYKNSLPCNFQVVVNGEPANATFTIEKESVVKQQGDLLVANGFGVTNLSIQAEADGEIYAKTFKITVKRVEKTVSENVPLFEVINGEYLDLESGERKNILSFINETGAVVDAYQDSRALTVADGKIFGVESSSSTQKGVANVSVGTDKIIYHFTLETFAKIIAFKEDIKSLELSDGKTLSGYYELINDIDASGITLNHVVTNDASFTGVFNGNGHSIYNLALKENSSLFGVLHATAIVKNFALINLNATKSYFLAQNTLGDGLTISDVYISLSVATVTPRGITGRTAENSIYKNVVIEYLGANALENRNYQDRWTWQGLIGGLWTYERDGKLYARDTKWSDVYVISPFVVSFRSDEKKDGANYAALYGYGANENKDIYGNEITGVTNNRDNPNLGSYWQTTLYYNALYTNLYHYNGYEALAKDARDFSTFSSDYWVVMNNKVIWKSLFSENLEINFFDGTTNLGEDTKIVGLNKQLSVKAFAEGETLEDISVLVEDNDYVVWDDQLKVLRLVTVPVGAVNVKVNFTVTVGGVAIEKTANLVAVGELINHSTVYDFIDESTGKMAGGAFPMSEIVGDEEIISIYQGANELSYNSEEGTLLGLSANITGTGEERTVKPVELTINTNGKVYTVKVKVYTKIIANAKDLAYFNQTLPENANNVYDGYYVLVNNIVDFTSEYNNVADSNHGLKPFTGTFDGNGHALSLKVNKGLFGTLGHGAVVKNTAFIDMQVVVNDAYKNTAILAGFISNATDVVVVKDLYITLDEQASYRQYLSKWFTTAMLVGNNASLNSKFANIVIEADILHSDYNSKGGAEPCLFSYWNGIDLSTKGGEYATNTAIDSLTNIFVISKDSTNMGGLFRVTAGIDRAVDKSMALCYNDYIVVAGGADTYTTLYLPNTYNNGIKDLVTMRRYDDYSAMASDNNDYSLFNANCWTLTGNTPVWKNK